MAATKMLAIFFMLTFSVRAVEDNSDAAGTTRVSTSNAGVSGVPVVEIAKRAVEVAAFLRTIEENLLDERAELDRITANLTRSDWRAGGERATTLAGLAGLERRQQAWQRRQAKVVGWLEDLTIRASHVQDAVARLTALQKEWAATRQTAQVSQEPDGIIRAIDKTFTDIDAARAPLEAQRASLLTLQSRVAMEVDLCGIELAQIEQRRKEAVAKVLSPNTPPIWSPSMWTAPWSAVSANYREVHGAFRNGLYEYAMGVSASLPIDCAIFAVLAIILCAARWWVRHWNHVGELESYVTSVFEHPFAAAFTVTLLFRTSPYTDAPAMGRGLLQTLALVSVIFLVRPATSTLVARALRALVVLFALDVYRQGLMDVSPIGQVLLLFENLAGMLAVAWLIRELWSRDNAIAPRHLPKLRLAAASILCAISVALVAGILGYQSLACLLTPMFLAAGTLAAMLYASVRVLSGIAALTLRVWPFRALRLVHSHRELLIRRAYHLLGGAALLAGLVRFLDFLGLLAPVSSSVLAFLATRFERGSVSITPADILAFCLTVCAAYLTSRFIRFVLHEDVYPRAKIAPGVSYAASNVLHYFILALGIMVGLGIMGVDLTHVTVLAGAFSVGIGFGLQGIVSNFVSGLILLVEQPLRVGDTVELGTVEGTVKRIGIRASVVHTSQGAETIVPNSELVSEQVTNWTLNDEMRRIDLPVGVDYGSDPTRVIEVVREVARSHPSIADFPEPACLFVGYGDNTINFELRAWTDRPDVWMRIRSELAVSVYQAIETSPGMNFRIPQCEEQLSQRPEKMPVAAPAGVADEA